MSDSVPGPAPGADGPEISGTTRLFAVIGDPVAQVRAPGLLNPLFRRLGTDAVLVPVHVRPEGLAEVLQGLRRTVNLDGLLITVPHKAACLRFADDVSPTAALSASTNAMRKDADGRWLAENFDGEGFVRGLRAAGYDPRGARVAQAGAGGAGSAIAVALLAAGADVAVWDRDPARADGLAARLAARWPGRITATKGLVAADITVNATPMGLRPDDSLPFDPAGLARGTVVADIIMKPRRTALLRAAEESGLPVHYGEPMLTEQLPLYREFFRIGAPGDPTGAS
ncbi:shikimate dehydrogenase [Streptomyces klenkii]|uniref:Shikimate dehydrogenase n=1 Tax=Streptomyces klenkii TaxID=1420899 RepID=A0A3B0AZT8_9ACTN|nr:shikimate dehydrogenase [Streptomyces klenkii]RKN65814.1 shikimate dehydrogenase [Streptomyces klenkii]